MSCGGANYCAKSATSAEYLTCRGSNKRTYSQGLPCPLLGKRDEKIRHVFALELFHKK